jgi:UDP-N-acetylmuramoyl-tripeptide--D-alanyl-D-alanine ligase
MREKHKGRTVTFGIDNPADVTASEIDTGHLGSIRFRLQTPLGETPATLPMSGRHNLMNALAAAAVATCFELQPGQIAAALKTAKPPRMRGEVLDFAAGFTVVDDSYNSNPRSLINMVRTITEAGVNAQRRIVIAGEMLELGPDEAALHREAGQEIGRAGVNVVWGVRGLGSAIVAGAREAGITEARFFETSDDAARALVAEVKEGDLVLIKGSRGVATDRIVAAIRERFALAGADE